MKTKTLLAVGGWRRLTWVAAIGVAITGTTTPAKAAGEIDNLDAPISCPARAFVSTISPRDLSREILGGAPSALERIRLRQMGAASASENLPQAAPVMSITTDRLWTNISLTPASQQLTGFIQPMLSNTFDECRSTLAERSEAPQVIPKNFNNLPKISDPSTGPGTRAVPIKHTRFDTRWAKVRRAAPVRLMQAELGKANVRRGLEEGEVFARVNRWVNRRIAYRSDEQNYRQRDFWATAQQTIARGSGDCEDFAVLKMHMLRTAGIDPRRMKLMLLRDLAANSDHAFLMVETSTGTVILDNTTDRVYRSDEAVAVRPVLSFGETGRWVHAYRDDWQPAIASVASIVSAPAAGSRLALVSADQRSLSAVLLTFNTGLSR